MKSNQTQFRPASRERRRFLKSLALSAAGLTAAAHSGLALPLNAFAARKHCLGTMDFSLLENAVGSTFQLTGECVNGFDVTLTKAETFELKGMPGAKSQPDQFEGFNLWFHTAPENLAPQDIYTLKHPTLGQFDVFLVPRQSRDGSSQPYQATITRLKQDSHDLA